MGRRPRSFTYDTEHQMVRVDLPGGGVASYRYDGLGRRIEKDVNGTITRYVYDQEDVVALYDGANCWQQHPGIPVTQTNLERCQKGARHRGSWHRGRHAGNSEEKWGRF